MNPLIAIAGTVLPEILKLVFGDKIGGVADAVQKAVTQSTGTADPAQAQKKVEEDPKAAAELRAKLAEIAANEEEKKRQAQIEILKTQLAAHEKEQQMQLTHFRETLKAEMEDTAAARGTFADLAKANSRFAWGAPVVSVIVTLGFFVILVVLLNIDAKTIDQGKLQVVNVIIGTLATAFATVVTFWLGSSQGSRDKDVTSLQIQTQQAKQTAEAVKSQTQAALEIARKQPSASPQSQSDGDKASNFDRCVDVILKWEGGFGNDPKDRGGATNLGITIGELKIWRGAEVTVDDVKNLEKKEAVEIYRTNYWNKLRCDDLPVGVDLVVFDFGVNAGVGRSAKFLQLVVGAAQDGSVGPATIAATKAQDATRVVKSLTEKRLAYYQGLSEWEHFGKGWTNRTNDVGQVALQLVATP